MSAGLPPAVPRAPRSLTVLGKSVSRRFLRRLDLLWRRNEAQVLMAKVWRGHAVRRQMRRERWRMAALVFHRCRQRAWQNFLRMALFQQRRRPAARERLGSPRGGGRAPRICAFSRRFLCQRHLLHAWWRRSAVSIQRHGGADAEHQGQPKE
eukprot:Skav234914  [mRNA]  locus=scaffold840:839314:841669:+ [translate_table: standard]